MDLINSSLSCTHRGKSNFPRYFSRGMYAVVKAVKSSFLFFFSGIAACSACFTLEFHSHPTDCFFFIVRQTSWSLSWSLPLNYLTYPWLRFTSNLPPEEPVTQVYFFSRKKANKK